MLSAEDNQLLTQVGPGTPMGNLMRQYWLPLMLSSDLEAAGRTVRTKLLGEYLIAFRDSAGRPGLVEANCAHRGAPLYFARNEAEGLRCVYHGWKYDVSGQCVDMPNEPAHSNFRAKVRITAYPCQERNGVIWTYMGPRETPPPLPNLEWNLLPLEHSALSRHLVNNNWVQALEGNIDTSHLSFLHTRLDEDGHAGFEGPGGRGLFYRDKTPHMEVLDTDYGVMYGAGRAELPGTTYWRVTQFLMPFWGMFAPISLRECPIQFWVPLDDEHTTGWTVLWNPTRPLSEEERRNLRIAQDEDLLPNTSDWYGRFRTKGNYENDYLMDWEAQQTKRFSGIGNIPLQDQALQEGMGPTVDRTREHLGTADAMIIRTRRRLINAAKALHDDGTVPPGVDTPDSYGVRSATAILDEGKPWLDGIREYLQAFTDKPVLSSEAQTVFGMTPEQAQSS